MSPDASSANPPADTSALRRALGAIQDLERQVSELRGAAHQPIAIVGMACRFPGAPSLDAYWQLLADGREAISEIPADRWDIDDYFDPDPDTPGTISSRFGAFIDNARDFDPGFFRISPREAAAMDPQQRLLLEVAWEALEDALIRPDALGTSPTGVYVGVTSRDYADVQIGAHGIEGLDAYYASGVAASVASGRLAYVLGLNGPAITVDTACSSSLVAPHLGVQALRAGEVDTAIVGGVNLMLTPETSVSLSKYHMLAPDGRCKTFDDAANGFGRGEGCGIAVLKRLADAIADGDPIHAVIRGSALNQDGASSGLTAPNGPSQEAVLRAALADAHMAPSDVQYVEAHGTGTELGDPIEIQALAAVHRGRSDEDRLLVGSAKTNIAHLEGAAGIAGLIKAALCVERAEIPAHRNLDTPNTHIDWPSLPIEIPTSHRAWPATGDHGRAVGVSSFGFSGTNAHLVLGEAPDRPHQPAAAATPATVVVSAASPEAAGRLAADYATLVERTPDQVRAIGAASTVGRAHLPHRIAVSGADAPGVAELLTAAAAGDEPRGGMSRGLVSSDPPKVGFLFTGQGAQYPGMARHLHESDTTFRDAFDRCTEALAPHLSSPLPDLIWGADPQLVHRTDVTQPALFAVEYALADWWEAHGVRASLMLGHSVGEYVAAARAGVFSLDDAAKLIAARGRLMNATPGDGAMAAVVATEAEVAELLADHPQVAIAAVNSEHSTVISGERNAVDAVSQRFSAAGHKVTELRVSHAFHSPMLEPMRAEFTEIANTITYHPPSRRLVTNLGGTVATASIASADHWVRHVFAPVDFHRGLRIMIDDVGCSMLIECGPHPTLLGMAAAAIGNGVHTIPSLRRDGDEPLDLHRALGRAWTAGAPVDWSVDAADLRATAPPLPSMSFDRVTLGTSHRADGARRTTGVHPLLGHRVNNPLATAAFENTFTVDAFRFLGDHRFGPTAILPGTGFMEMTVAAASIVAGGDVTVADLVIGVPLVVPDGEERIVQTLVHERDGDAWTVEIVSFDGATWTTHTSATVTATRLTLAAPDAAAARDQADRVVTSVEHYDRLADVGLEFGASLRVLGDAAVGDEAATASVGLDEVERRSAPRYHVHPALLDGAIQAVAAMTAGDETFLPTSIDTVAVLQTGATAGTTVARLRPQPSGADSAGFTADIHLLDDDGQPIAAVTGIHFRRASLADLPGAGDVGADWLYAPTWTPAPLARPLDVPAAAAVGGHDLARHADAFDIEHYVAALDALEAASTGFIVDALRVMGASTTAGSVLRARDLGVISEFERLFDQLMGFLVADGLAERETDGFRLIADLEAPASIDWDDLERRFPEASGELTVTRRCGDDLAGALTGRRDPLELLFPGGSTDAADQMYHRSPFARFYNALAADAVAAFAASRPTGPFRVLEIGGGTGGTTASILPRLAAETTSYTFTDISPAFLGPARDRFAEYEFVDYQTLDIEADPGGQGFDAGAYDLIVAANVLHATTDLATTFGHIRSLLAEGGALAMVEMVAVRRFIAITFGLTEGWWRFTDLDLRPDSLLLDEAGWHGFLPTAGLAPVDTLAGADGNQAVVLAGRAPDGAHERHIVVLDRHRDAARVAATLEELGPWSARAADLDAIAGEATSDLIVLVGGGHDLHDNLRATADAARHLIASGSGRLWIVSAGAAGVGGHAPDPDQAGVWGFGRALALEHPELEVTCVDLDPALDWPAGQLAEELTATGEDQIARRIAGRFVARLHPQRDEVVEPRALAITERGSLDNLELAPAAPRAPGAGEVEIEVRATGLNFRDVLNTLGMYPGDPGPPGGECAGIVRAVGEGVTEVAPGDAVIAIAVGSFRSTLTCDARFVVPKPPRLSFSAAASVLIPHVTAHFALDEIAGVQAGQHVLIHSAAGGVGLAAVALAHARGAIVHATAGSETKRTHLLDLGVATVHDSRSLSFADEIREATGGRGVDIVVNSLAGEAVALSRDLVVPGGHYLELGKSDHLDDTDATAYRTDRGYHLIDWSEQTQTQPDLMRRVIATSLAFAEANPFALPITEFAFDDVVDAFRHMAQARHIGKIVVTHPVPATPRPIRPGAAYLITGGVAGLGLLTAEHLAAHGADHLVLLGRSEPTADARRRIDELVRDDVTVDIVVGDVADQGAVSRAFAAAGDDLAGIFHSAGTLRDAAIENQTWDDMEAVLRPKVDGLDQLLAALGDRAIDHLVIYSSVAGLIGSPGQTNHAAANAYLDAVALQRSASGRPALSINWGAWSGTGAAVATGAAARADDDGLGTMRPSEGLAVLDRLLAGSVAQIGVVPGDLAAAERRFGGRVPPLLRDLVRRSERHTPTRPTDGGTPSVLAELDSAGPERRAQLLQDFVRQHVCHVLDLAESRVPDDMPLSELGLDSLMAVELRNRLSSAAPGEDTLPATLVFDHPTVAAIATYLDTEVLGGGAEPEPDPPTSNEPPATAAGASAMSLLDDLESLSDDELAERLAQRRGDDG